MGDPASFSPRGQDGRIDRQFERPGGVERCTMGCLSVLFGLLAFWMGWIVATFLDGNGWFDLIVRLILDELIVAVTLLSLVLLIWALFVPARMARVFASVSANVVKMVAIFFAVLIVPALLFVVAWSILAALGIVK